MQFARIKDNKVVSVFTELPKTLENVSGLSALSLDDLAGLGIVPLDAELAAEVPKDITDKAIAQKTRELWMAASAYERSYISGMAVFLLAVGIMRGDAQCLDIAKWSERIWTEYYRRKNNITLTDDIDTDFGICGPMPYTISEIMTTVWFN